jgi:NADP-dependent 3-hydroxy acid dehydrogenase YdfG
VPEAAAGIAMRLKPIGQQVAVIVRASSGINRETARRFAKLGEQFMYERVAPTLSN